jgi:uncharacterized protein
MLRPYNIQRMMENMVSEQILADVTKRLVDGFHPDRIILFGSQARDTANEHSDVDILVICPVKDDRHILTLAMFRALRGLGIAKDIIVITPEEFERDRRIPGTVARPAWLEGKILYERN